MLFSNITFARKCYIQCSSYTVCFCKEKYCECKKCKVCKETKKFNKKAKKPIKMQMIKDFALKTLTKIITITNL